MSDQEPRGFSRRHREGMERVRRKNLEGRDAPNVVPLRRPRTRRELRMPPLPSSSGVLWGLIVMILIAVYFIQLAF